jgi:hypothetical protein
VADFGACRAVTDEARALLAQSEKVLETMRNGDWKDEDPSGRESNALLKALGQGDGSTAGGDSTDR